jgi:hypothetical protein
MPQLPGGRHAVIDPVALFGLEEDAGRWLPLPSSIRWPSKRVACPEMTELPH